MDKMLQYDEFMNEKVSWYNKILAGLAIIITLTNIYGKFSKKGMVELFKDIKNPSLLPQGNNKKLISQIRSEVISEIETSTEIDSFKKKVVLDSLRNIPFFITDLSKYKKTDDAAAIYFHMPYQKAKFAGFEIENKSPTDPINFILVDEKEILKDNASEMISHEIYHYIDRLLGSDDKHWSQINEIASAFDLSMDENEIGQTVCYLAYGEVTEKGLDKTKFIANHIYKNKEYYTRPTELFVRYHNLKAYLVKQGQLKTIHDKITEDNLDYIVNLNFLDMMDKDFGPILPFLNYKKIDNMNKIISSSVKKSDSIA